MSKPVRLPDYLAAEVQRLADVEKRSLANMVKVLLEQALKIEGSGAAVGEAAVSGSAESIREEEEGLSRSNPVRPERAAPEDHFKPDFKKPKK